jgi:TetR/AcrR family transcriptional regulator, regulator of autoinduction and epiphytic fitness
MTVRTGINTHELLSRGPRSRPRVEADAHQPAAGTLFKQFPTKAALFDAIVTESWSAADEEDPPPAGNVVDGLGIIGRHYAELLGRARMADLFRIVIAELPRFPELAHAQFSQGKMPYFESWCRAGR